MPCTARSRVCVADRGAHLLRLWDRGQRPLEADPAEWRQYEEISPALNASRITQVSLECANSRVPMSLLGLLKDKAILLGAIDVATLEIETPERWPP